MALAMYHLSVCIVSRWMEKRKKEKLNVVGEVNLDAVEESVSRSEYGEEQIRDYQYALRMIECANQMNSTPIVAEHYQAILAKISPVLLGRDDDQKIDY